VIFGWVSILAVVVVVVLVTTGCIKEEYYPYCIMLMAFGLVYSITLLGSYVVGSDIQGELAASRISLANGWNFTEATPENAITGINLTSVVTGLLAPGLARLLHMDLVWVFKVVLPLFLVAVPVVMYSVFKKQMGGQRAFYATLFFIIMPVFNQQLAQIVKSMVAELFFALAIWVMVSDWGWRGKILALAGCVIGASVSHYTIGIALIVYLAGIVLVRIATSWMTWKLWAVRKAPVFVLVMALLPGIFAFQIYYHYAYGGAVNQVLLGTAKWYGSAGPVDMAHQAEVPVAETPDLTPTLTPTPTGDPTSPTPSAQPPAATTSDSLVPKYLYNQEYTVQVGIGLDFLQQPLAGKLFRLVQYLTQGLIMLGAVYLLFRSDRYRFTAEFVAGIGGSFVLLLACIFVPQFSSIINMPRFYQISLFFLAPMLVVGCDAVAGIGKKAISVIATP